MASEKWFSEKEFGFTLVSFSSNPAPIRMLLYPNYSLLYFFVKSRCLNSDLNNKDSSHVQENREIYVVLTYV